MKQLYYHYTSLEAFKNIIESKTLWLTKSNFLNDKSEVINGADSIKEMISITLEEITHKNVIAFFKEHICPILDILDKTEIYIVSFSKKMDKKSQWQEYAKNGVAIGFDDSIFPKDDLNVLGLNDCLYTEEEKREALRELVTKDILFRKYANIKNKKFDWDKEWGVQWNSIFNSIKSALIELGSLKEITNKLGLSTSLSDIDLQILNIQLYARIKLVALSCRFKDEHFYEEEESRFFRIINRGEIEKVYFRVNRNNLIPYIPTKINLSSIKSITFSPNLSDSNKESIKYFLKKYKTQNCKFVESQVPLR
jgi:hypothetical protein